MWRPIYGERKYSGLAADLAASAGSNIGMSELRRRARALNSCITGPTKDTSIGNMKVAEVGATCANLLAYTRGIGSAT